MNPEWLYDVIAPIYDRDMGLNMPFDDVSGYLHLLPPVPARLLEVGCGTGRLTLPLADLGYSITAIDRSAPMLMQLQSKLCPEHDIDPVHMDARHISLTGPFDAVFFSYSGFQYLLSDKDISLFCRRVRHIVAPGGALVLDIFLRRSGIETGDFILDYERELEDGRVLTRHKRVSVGNGVNDVLRRYAVSGKGDTIHYETRSSQRLYTPESLASTLAEQGFMLDAGIFDYQAPGGSADCFHRFYTARFLPS